MIRKILKIISVIFQNKRNRMVHFQISFFCITKYKSPKSRLFLRIYYVENQLNKYDFLKWAALNLRKSHSVDYQNLLVQFLSLELVLKNFS